MKLSSKSRYAVMALTDLAKFNTKDPVTLRDISLRQGISLVYLEQLFLKLKKNKIVKSIRGKKGGYILWYAFNIGKKSCKDVVKYLNKISKNKFIEKMNRKNIQIRPIWKLNHLQKPYKNFYRPNC